MQVSQEQPFLGCISKGSRPHQYQWNGVIAESPHNVICLKNEVQMIFSVPALSALRATCRMNSSMGNH
jgi:hypothetical protein